MGSGFGGLTEGLWQSISGARAEQERREKATAEREAKVLGILAESDDPEIRSMAVAGMLEQVNPRKRVKGIRGFFGEMERSETLPRIRALLDTPVEKQVTTPGLPSRGIPASVGATAIPKPPPSMGGAAMVEGSPTTGTPMTPQGRGAAPPPGPLPAVLSSQRLGMGEPPPGSGAFTEQRDTPRVGRTDTVLAPRQVFLQPDERIRRDTIAREQAEVEGEVAGLTAAGFSEQEARQLVKDRYQRLGRGRSAGLQKQAVEIPKADGSTEVLFAVFDPNSGKFFDPDSQQVIEGARPVSNAARMSFGIEAERAAGAKYGKSFGQLTPEEKADIVNTELPKIAAQISGARTRATGDQQNITKMQAPISVDDAAQLQVPVGTTMAGVAGQVPQTPAQQEMRQMMTALTPQLDQIRANLRDVLPSKDGLGGLLPGAYIALQQTNPEYRVKMAKLRASVDIAVNNIARILGGQRGAQTEKDAERAYQSLVSLQGALTADTAEAAEARIEETIKAMASVQAALPAQMAPTTPGAAAAPGAPTDGAATPGGDVDTQTGKRKGDVVKLKDGTYREITGVNPLRWKAATGPR